MRQEKQVTEELAARGLIRFTRIHPEVSVSTTKLDKDSESYKEFESKFPTNTKNLDYETCVLLRSSWGHSPTPLAMHFSATKEEALETHSRVIQQFDVVINYDGPAEAIGDLEIR